MRARVVYQQVTEESRSLRLVAYNISLPTPFQTSLREQRSACPGLGQFLSKPEKYRKTKQTQTGEYSAEIVSNGRGRNGRQEKETSTEYRGGRENTSGSPTAPGRHKSKDRIDDKQVLVLFLSVPEDSSSSPLRSTITSSTNEKYLKKRYLRARQYRPPSSFVEIFLSPNSTSQSLSES